MGLLHDFGKGTADFQNYLRGAGSRHHNHAGLGALLCSSALVAEGGSEGEKTDCSADFFYVFMGIMPVCRTA